MSFSSLNRLLFFFSSSLLSHAFSMCPKDWPLQCNCVMYFPPEASAIVPDASTVVEDGEGSRSPPKGRLFTIVDRPLPTRPATPMSAVFHKESAFHQRTRGTWSFDRTSLSVQKGVVMKINDKTELNIGTPMTANDNSSELETAAKYQASSSSCASPPHTHCSFSSKSAEERTGDALQQLGIDVTGWERVGPINLMNFICSNVPKLGKDNPISPSKIGKKGGLLISRNLIFFLSKISMYACKFLRKLVVNLCYPHPFIFSSVLFYIYIYIMLFTTKFALNESGGGRRWKHGGGLARWHQVSHSDCQCGLGHEAGEHGIYLRRLYRAGDQNKVL